MEMATRPEFLDLQIEEVKVSPTSSLAGKSIRHSRVRVDLGRTRGRIVIEFASVDDLDRIVGLLGPPELA